RPRRPSKVGWPTRRKRSAGSPNEGNGSVRGHRLDFLRHGSGVRWGKKRPPSTNVVGGRFGVAHRPTVGRAIPRLGCVPAEPASVSPGDETIPGNGGRKQGRLPPGKSNCRQDSLRLKGGRDF